MGLRELCELVHQAYRDDNLPRAQKEMYTTLPEMAMRPADAYECLVRGRVESVEIDKLMGRTLAVMVVPYPPGIPLIMPGERITPATKSIHEYLLYARDLDRRFPGFETDIHGLRFEPIAAGGRRYMIDCVTEGGSR
jgi:arginine decarboxylase